MIVDVTTRNLIFNTLSFQSTWFKHRWGKRNYPMLDLSLNQYKLLNFGEDTVFRSVFGDPAEWVHFDQVVNNFNNDNRLHVTTYGMRLLPDHVRKIILIDGINEACGKVFLNADWEQISSNIEKDPSNTRIEFYLFEHNKHQIPAIQKFCKINNVGLTFITPNVDHTGKHAVIDSDCNWLYDVVPHQYSNTTDYTKCLPHELIRHVDTYNFLKTTFPGVQGISILESPTIINQSSERVFDAPTTYGAISPTGHVFDSEDDLTFFMNLIPDDWTLDKHIDANYVSDYEKQVYGYARRFTNKFYLDSISLS